MFTRMYTAEQIQVPVDLPAILKAYAKAVIKSDPKDLISFSLDYFVNLVDHPPVSAEGYRLTLDGLHELQMSLSEVLQSQSELRRVDFQLASEQVGIDSDVIANILRQGFADKEVVDLYLFMGIGVTLLSASLEMSIANLFKVFEDEQGQSKIPTVSFLGFLQWLTAKDPTAGGARIERIKERVEDDTIDLATYRRVCEQ